MTDDETDARQQKLEQLKAKMEEKQRRENEEQEASQKIDTLLRQTLDTAAKQRLSNVALVNRELYLKTTQAILYLIQKQRFDGKITDQQVKQLLERLSQKRETTIRRK